MSNQKSELNDFVASFRIPRALKAQIEQFLKDHPVVGCKSANQYMRKLAMDRFTRTVQASGSFASKQQNTVLFYPNSQDDTQSPELMAATRQLQAAQPRAVAG